MSVEASMLGKDFFRQPMNENSALSDFSARHIGPRAEQVATMLKTVGAKSLDELIDKTVPAAIKLKAPLNLPGAKSETEVLAELFQLAAVNKVFHSLIGMGYHDTVTPNVILRNIMENPGWYTQYTPYQAEISQGRLEALVNFQTMVTDLTGMEIANASMLDEGTAAAEAMMLCYRVRGSEERNRFLISDGCHPHVIEVVVTRAIPLGIIPEVVSDDRLSGGANTFGVLTQYPRSDGEIVDYRSLAKTLQLAETMLVVSADILALTLLTPPGEWGADVVVGSTQRFGVPLGFGGPHAAYFATRDAYKRELPGRLIGVSKDTNDRASYRLALQTREQHIRRDRATSNICTAQVLLAIMASMYAVYHGPVGLKRIASRVHWLTAQLAEALRASGLKIRHEVFFDTLRVEGLSGNLSAVKKRLEAESINLRWFEDGSVGISLDETTDEALLSKLLLALTGKPFAAKREASREHLPAAIRRSSSFLTHPVFSRYHSETELLRYINRLQSRDLSLTASMIPLGSCTMKLNATAEMIPVTWSGFSRIHPFSPLEQVPGYIKMIGELEDMLAEITGFAGVSLQPNAGSQGEYAGLLAIMAYHKAKSQEKRRICLIPTSAHGTNPASAAMAGMNIVTVSCDASGNVDVEDLRAKAREHRNELACLMVTYPSTHGVFEESIKEICEIIHQNGGQVYMDGANMNAQVGLCRPGDFGVDVCHLNLHKTFCIPHGGGGPGVGPIAVAKHLVDYLPGHFHLPSKKQNSMGPVSSAPWGSAGILVIPWVYIRLMGAEGLKRATQVAILNANYIATRLEPHFPVLYRGRNGTVAHECILDLRNLKRAVGVEAGDVAKRLMDYGFHAPTVSFPVVETLMVEPTESESLEELDRFCEAMISIREEINEVESGKADKVDNVLKNAPHTAEMLSADVWPHKYSRQKAAYPLASLRQFKFWPAVGRVDNAHGDRNLFCSCVPVSE